MSSTPPPPAADPAPIPDAPRDAPPLAPVVTPIASGAQASIAERLAARAPLSDALAFSLVAIHIVLFAQIFISEGRGFELRDLWLAIPSRVLVRSGAVVPSLVREGDWWRILAAPLLHADAFYLLICTLYLRSVAALAERVLGRGAVALGLLGGAVGSALWTCTQDGGMLSGAFGAASGVAGALVTGLRGPGLPEAWARQVRRSLLWRRVVLVGFFVALDLAIRLLQVPAILGSFYDVLVGGFLGGLVAGLLVAPPLVPWAALTPSRRALHGAALALALVAALGMGLTGNSGVARVLVWARGGDWVAYQLERDRPRPDGDADFEASAHLVPGLGGDLRTESVPSLGLTLDVPSGWTQLQLTKQYVAYGPSRGAPFLQIHVLRVPGGAVGPDYSDPDILLGELRGELERAGAGDVVAAPFTKARLGGLIATRVEIRYRQSGMDLQQIALAARGRRTIYLVEFLGLDESAAAIAARLASGLRFSEGAGE